MNRRYDAVVFDLDGTLLDTLADLTGSANAAAGAYGFGEYSQDDIRRFVGNGIRRLIERMLPDGTENPHFDEVYHCFCEHYGQHCMDETEPYPGVMGLLDYLRKEGYRLAIVSNKADFAVKKLRDVYFGELIEVAVGEREGCRRKPAPDAVWQALAELQTERERAVYIGDSDVDLMTAQNAGMDCILVSWGFRSREFLIAHGGKPEQIAANVNEVKELLAPRGDRTV